MRAAGPGMGDPGAGRGGGRDPGGVLRGRDSVGPGTRGLWGLGARRISRWGSPGTQRRLGCQSPVGSASPTGLETRPQWREPQLRLDQLCP